MKKVLCLVLSVVLFSLSFSFVSSHSASADSVFDFSLTSVLDYTRSTLLSYTQSLQKRIVAARSFYFYIILNDGYSSGLSIFDSSGQKFSDDILNFYYDQYCTTKSAGDIYNSDGDVFIQAAGFTDPWSLRLCCFSHGVSDNPTLYPDDMEKPYFKQYYNTELARYLIAQGETATDPNPGKSGLDIAPGYVSSEELVEGIEKDNSLYTPKSSLYPLTYKTDKNFQFVASKKSVLYQPVIMFSGFLLDDVSSFYFIPYVDYQGIKYYGQYQFKFFFDYSDGGLFPRLYAWNVIDGSEENPIDLIGTDFNCFGFPYISFSIMSSGVSLRSYSSFEKFTNNLSDNQILLNCSPAGAASKYFNPLFSENLQSAEYGTFLTNSDHAFKDSWSSHSNCFLNDTGDIGLLCSDSIIPFSYAGIIDTTQIPSNQIITVNGDTIYNYTITNPETGDSSKFGDYITNNYTYITNNYGGSESGGSSGSGASGNVTVGGSIDVGGSVGVDINVSVPDININVNGNGGAGGSGSSISNPDDFTSADNVDLNKYYDEAVEQSTGFQKFLNDFFGFLPAELLGLILFAVAMAIVCRVFGR